MPLKFVLSGNTCNPQIQSSLFRQKWGWIFLLKSDARFL